MHHCRLPDGLATRSAPAIYRPFQHSSPSRACCKRKLEVCRAERGSPPPRQGTENDDDLEEYERNFRNRRRSARRTPPKDIAPAEKQTDDSGWADWPEGALLPKGWDQMNGLQRASELWSGKRGALFWANKIAWAALFVIGGGWVLFRIVGPATGLYKLTNDIFTPPSL